MRVYDLIAKKRDGFPLSKEEIDFLIEGYTKNEIDDYQMAAWLMAAFIRGLNEEETSNLTMSMVKTGKTIDLSSIKGVKVDKHSTGGVGDKTTIVLAPLIASIGIPVAKMSGRGLGHTGGTLDKLEAIPGFDVNLTSQEFIENVNTIGIAIMGQSDEIVPADKKLYSLRDVTATVNSIPLIASSIMSKKIASGADCIVLDVKVGSGAFMKNYDDALKLAQTMVQIGNMLNRKTIAVISNMDQPLGYTIGNSLEVKEAIETLQGNGPKDLTELCLELGIQILSLAGVTSDRNKARTILVDSINSGKAFSKFRQLIYAQKGDLNVLNNLDMLSQAAIRKEFISPSEGYIKSINAELVGKTSLILGAGRQKKGDKIDLFAGIELKKKVGDKVLKGESLATLYFNNPLVEQEAILTLGAAYQFSDLPVQEQPIILGTVK
ncbi:MAG TPA: pyrimidine-nucleoside phosphorylase [Clostridia bacterium]|nr:pyrimidine-nucleoside phosphorylase [Clostridia bacterium]